MIAIAWCLAACLAKPDEPAVGTVQARHWAQRAGSEPGALFAPRLTYDARRRELLLYGGNEAVSDTASDKMWKLGATGWVKVCDPCAPGRRVGHGFAYDPKRGVTVLFGGTDNTTSFEDVWEWDGAAWKKIAAATLPGPRRGVQLVFDSKRQQLVLIGGEATAGVDAAIYTYDGAFHAVATTGTSPGMLVSYASQATYEPTADAFVISLDNDPFGPSPHDDLFALAGTTWARACTACTGEPRVAEALLYDRGLDTTLVIGGFRGDMQTLAGTWRRTGTTFELIDPGPPARDTVGIAYDTDRDVIVIYGGNGTSCGGNCAETWEYLPDY